MNKYNKKIYIFIICILIVTTICLLYSNYINIKLINNNYDSTMNFALNETIEAMETLDIIRDTSLGYSQWTIVRVSNNISDLSRIMHYFTMVSNNPVFYEFDKSLIYYNRLIQEYSGDEFEHSKFNTIFDDFYYLSNNMSKSWKRDYSYKKVVSELEKVLEDFLSNIKTEEVKSRLEEIH